MGFNVINWYNYGLIAIKPVKVNILHKKEFFFYSTSHLVTDILLNKENAEVMEK